MRRCSDSEKGPDRGTTGTHECERGSAAIEFIVAGLILIVPLLYLVLALGTVQEQALGVQTGAREISRAVATAENAHVGRERARAISDSVAAAYGIDPDGWSVSIDCAPKGSVCPDEATSVTVRTSVRVALPLMPEVFGLQGRTSIPVAGRAVHPILEGDR